MAYGLTINVFSVSYTHLDVYKRQDLDRIKIAVMTLPGGSLPDKTHMEQLIDDVLSGVDGFGLDIPDEVRNGIVKGMESMRFSPAMVLSKLDGNENSGRGPLSLAGDRDVTQLVIRPYDPVLDADLAAEASREVSS